MFRVGMVLFFLSSVSFPSPPQVCRRYAEFVCLLLLKFETIVPSAYFLIGYEKLAPVQKWLLLMGGGYLSGEFCGVCFSFGDKHTKRGFSLRVSHSREMDWIQVRVFSVLRGLTYVRWWIHSHTIFHGGKKVSFFYAKTNTVAIVIAAFSHYMNAITIDEWRAAVHGRC